jgi:hypothetical protein
MSATRAFYDSYAAALQSHRRGELADFYHPQGATIILNGERNVSTHDEIARRYRERWQGPDFFAFDSLRFEPLGAAHVLVSGAFRWLSRQSADTTRYIYLALLENTSAGPRIRVEHETRRPAVARPPSSVTPDKRTLPDSAAIRELIALEHHLNDLLNQRDWQAYAPHVLDDYRQTTREGVVRSKHDVVNALQQAAASPPAVRTEPDSIHVRVYGDTGILTAVLTGRRISDGAVTFRSRILKTFIRRDGRWYLAAMQGTSL